MEFHQAHLTQTESVDRSDCCVSSDVKLLEVFQKTAEGGRPFMLVEDKDGAPVGIVSADEVLQRVRSPHPMEVGRWMDMPVESALQGRFQMPDEAGKQTSLEDCTTISRDGVLLGVMTDDDVLISWRSIQKTLQASQGDAVTGLPNRARFDQHLEAECNRAARNHVSVSVILIDLDYFKPINDQFGHAAGDIALKTVSQTLRKNLRSYDMVARFGGDEFAAVCTGCRPGEISIVLRRIRECVIALQEDPDVPRPIPTVSVGACVVHDFSMVSGGHEIVKRADETLYAAKEAGRNCAFKMELHPRFDPTPVVVNDKYTNDPRYVPSPELVAAGR